MDNKLPISTQPAPAAPFGTVSPRSVMPQPVGTNPLPVTGGPSLGASRKSDTPTLDSMMQQRGTDGGGNSALTPRLPSALPAEKLIPSPNPISTQPQAVNPISSQPQQSGLIPPYSVSPGTIPMLNQAGVNNSGAFLPGLQQVQNGQNNPWNVNFESVNHNPFSGGNGYQGLYGSR